MDAEFRIDVLEWLAKKEKELANKPDALDRVLVFNRGKQWTAQDIRTEIWENTETGKKFLNMFRIMPKDEWDRQFSPGDI